MSKDVSDKNHMTTLPAVEAKSVSLNDATDIVMANGIKGSIKWPRAFIPNADGVLSIIDGSGATVAIPVVQGILYPIVAQRFRSTGSSGVTSVVALG